MCEWANSLMSPDFYYMNNGKHDSVFVSEHVSMLRRMYEHLISFSPLQIKYECSSASHFGLIYVCLEKLSGKLYCSEVAFQCWET